MNKDIGRLLVNKIGPCVEVDTDASRHSALEKMLDFCFAYGRLGHISRECLLEEPHHMIANNKFPIGNWLKGSSFAKPFDHRGRWEEANGFGRPSPLKENFDEPGPVPKDATVI
ncbi:hypothetical protein PanWU01x14_011920 [Parasponia andersonii]|uniref:Zinc finger, CCHC-type n=1 Tax=Parasponia andersonii TaxID=3476 RepID=A0A2P5E1R9_PARAD|nr:hypothetical protein PanWU01x14_011920 [Parasponia andersonii]